MGSNPTQCSFTELIKWWWWLRWRAEMLDGNRGAWKTSHWDSGYCISLCTRTGYKCVPDIHLLVAPSRPKSKKISDWLMDKQGPWGQQHVLTMMKWLYDNVITWDSSHIPSLSVICSNILIFLIFYESVWYKRNIIVDSVFWFSATNQIQTLHLPQLDVTWPNKIEQRWDNLIQFFYLS